ncbi:hypothetical protein [Agromyces larvae]|uniref:Uncharacterized protein n=1 Tax=Agromyces larvae TaxID=2929802 RepID=A0ABY4CB82_9MICO|nr:hypothetical protein [Agromyces larvae]UOE45955.1 hypothetical protein MTO99_09500 [Agromyces larvae]
MMLNGSQPLAPDAITVARYDRDAPAVPRGDYGRYPTNYRLTLIDGRTRRVYVDVYSNGGGTPYVVIRGEVAYLTDESIRRMERDACTRPRDGYPGHQGMAGYGYCVNCERAL